ncbi:MAG: hypothetical protein ACFB6S_15600 [Geminicoccaceae bacterium]
MPSAIDASKPEPGMPANKADFRDNFQAAARELDHGGFFRGAGAGALERSTAARLGETVSVRDFGAIADGGSHPVSEWLKGGAHDRHYPDLDALRKDFPHVGGLDDEIDWAASQAAFAHIVDVGGGRISWPDGTYVVFRTLGGDVAGADLSLDFGSARVFQDHGQTCLKLHQSAAWVHSERLEGKDDAYKGELTRVVFDRLPHDLRRDSAIKITAEDNYPWFQYVTHRLGEALRVRSFDGDAAIVAGLRYRDAYRTNIRAAKYRDNRLSISGGVFFSNENGNPETLAGDMIQIIGFDQPEMRDLTVRQGWSTGFMVLGCLSARAIGCRVSRLADFDTTGVRPKIHYGYAFKSQSSKDTQFLGCTATHCRHGLDANAKSTDGRDLADPATALVTGYDDGLVFQSGTFANCNGSAVGIHASSLNVTIRDTAFLDVGYAIQFRGWHHRAENCWINSCGVLFQLNDDENAPGSGTRIGDISIVNVRADEVRGDAVVYNRRSPDRMFIDGLRYKQIANEPWTPKGFVYARNLWLIAGQNRELLKLGDCAPGSLLQGVIDLSEVTWQHDELLRVGEENDASETEIDLRVVPPAAGGSLKWLINYANRRARLFGQIDAADATIDRPFEKHRDAATSAGGRRDVDWRAGNLNGMANAQSGHQVYRELAPAGGENFELAADLTGKPLQVIEIESVRQGNGIRLTPCPRPGQEVIIVNRSDQELRLADLPHLPGGLIVPAGTTRRLVWAETRFLLT